MKPLEAEVTDIFTPVAKEAGLPSRKTAEDFQISGDGILLRVLWEIDRIKGAFVTLERIQSTDAKPGPAYGLSYLVDFEILTGGDSRDEADAKTRDPRRLAELASKYAVDYLKAGPAKFDLFASYAADRVKGNLSNMPTIKATKHIRPEWL